MDMPTSALTGVSLKDLFDAGLHFGHQTKRWNPKMKGYIFDKRNGLHIIDLTQTVSLLDEAAAFLRETILSGKKVLFVATKKQVSELVKEAAQGVNQFYITERWLGGTLTNSKTIRSSVKRMRQLQATAAANGGELSEHKQEASRLRRELNKLEKNLTGIADMAEEPGALVVVDVVKEANAIKEAVRLHIPIVALVDSNADPEPIDYVIPGNDDSVRGVQLIMDALAGVIKTADAEYAQKASEEARRREEDRRKRDEAERAARAERRAKTAPAKGGEKPKAGKKLGGVAANVKAAAKAAKEEAEKKAKEDLAARRQAAVIAAAEEVAAGTPDAPEAAGEVSQETTPETPAAE